MSDEGAAGESLSIWRVTGLSTLHHRKLTPPPPRFSYADVCLAPDSSNPAIALGRVLDGHRAGLSTRAAVLKSRYDPCEYGAGWER